MPDEWDQVLTQSELEDAQKLVRGIRERQEAEGVEGRRANNAFHTNLALFSGGTVALSITYLGYLRSGQHVVIHSGLLVASWACLLAAVPLSLFYPFLHTSYTSYARMREYLDAKIDQRNAEAEVAVKLPVLNLPTSEDRERERARLQTAADELRPLMAKCARWESFYFFAWKWGGFASMLLFVVGLALLFWFAIFNM